jgi:glycosyltransferase involved in cell wall biosynthesis
VTSVWHVLDASCDWQVRVALTHLLNSGALRDSGQFVAALPGTPLSTLRGAAAFVPIRRLPIRVPLLAAPVLARCSAGVDDRILHAWGVRAALVAASVGAGGRRNGRVVVSLHDPRLTERECSLLRSVCETRRAAIACASERLRRRLVEHGVPPAACVVIRPGVDFGRINAARRSPLRAELQAGRERRLVLVPEPELGNEDELDGVMAAALQAQHTGSMVAIVPGGSRGARRMVRMVRALPDRTLVAFAAPQVPFEDLLAVSDVFVRTARGDVPTTDIAWAMGARSVVVATAVHCIAELIAHKLNGLLCKAEAGRRLVRPLARLIGDREAQDRVRETAHGQAFEVFGVHRFVEQTVRLYENLREERPAGDGITDAAMVT